MFAVKIIKMIAAHRNQKWFELKMRDPHTGFGWDAVQHPSAPSDEKIVSNHPAEDSLPPGF